MENTPLWVRIVAVILLVLMVVSVLPLNAAASHSSGSSRELSSSARRAINNLDEDKVKEIRIPVLLGVSLAQIYPNFGDDRDGGDRKHEGEDIIAPRGTYIVSPTEAVVIAMGNEGSAGKYVYTANPGGERFAYMHLDDFAEDLKVGTVLKVGDLIGYLGDTGNAKGGVPHLHFEIRNGRKAIDPFPRLKKEFTLKERVSAIERALDGADDEQEDAERLVKDYGGTILAAQAAGYDLPTSLEKELKKAGLVILPPASLVRDLTTGSSGDDVRSLQLYLIGKATGPSAKALSGAGATGTFGPATLAALTEFQIANGILPATGYFGPKTRAYLALNP